MGIYELFFESNKVAKNYVMPLQQDVTVRNWLVHNGPSHNHNGDDGSEGIQG